jgi:acetoacetyl-CoA synthetase
VVGSNCVRSLALQLATGAIGGVFASFATDIGEKALSDRLKVLEPRVFFSEVTYSYNGKQVNILDKTTNVYRQMNKPLCELILIGAPSPPAAG